MKLRRCGSDLSRDPATVSGAGPLPCEVEGEHEVHEHTSPPFQARWRDLGDGGRVIEFMTLNGVDGVRVSG